MAPGYHPTGINPSSFDLPGSNDTTATAFCVPLQTKRVEPDLSKVSAFGAAPKRSLGFCRIQIVSMTPSVRVSITLSVSLAALATTNWRPLGESAIADA